MNIHELIHRPLKAFFDRKIDFADIKASEEEEKTIATTFRLPADIRSYYQLMADASRTTLQGAVLQVLGSVMDAHIIDQPAEKYASKISSRFFEIFKSAGISIRKIPCFLHNFNVTQEDLNSNNKIVEMIANDQLVEFLALSFNLNRDWITCESKDSHKELWCDSKNAYNIHSLIQCSPNELELNILFDESIIESPTDNASNIDRSVRLFLVEKGSANNVTFNRAYVFSKLDWDHERSRNVLASAVAGMESNRLRSRYTKFFTYDSESLDKTELGIHSLNQFQDINSIYPRLRADIVDITTMLQLQLKKTIELYKQCNNELPKSSYIASFLKLQQSKLDEIFYLSGSEFAYYAGDIFPKALVDQKRIQKYGKIIN